MSRIRILVTVLVAMCATSPPLGTESAPFSPAPPVHAVDVWLGDAPAVGVDPAWAQAAQRQSLRVFPTATATVPTAPAVGLGAGMQLVGGIAVMEGDDLTADGLGMRRGIQRQNLAEICRRFIAAFGDHYDQIAVFLAFSDYAMPQTLAYQMPIKNDVEGIGLGIFDSSAEFGSPSGRLQTALNMKRILAYGRDAANDPASDLYTIWAQEAAHRWAAYLRFKREGDAEPSDALLGRQKAHWAQGVQADASIMDGYLWSEESDGTFSPTERNKRYGALDQYAMGLRPDVEVPPFFLLQELRFAQDDTSIGTASVVRGIHYKAQKLVLSIRDITRALGPRRPATDLAARDLRMGVVLLTSPGVPAEQVVGESFRIDRTRRLWDDFYNTAGGGRGKVCTELLHPCRGLALTFGDPVFTTGRSPAPGDPFSLEVPLTNVGDAAASARLHVDGRGRFSFTSDTIATSSLAPGAMTKATFAGSVPLGTPCGQPLSVDFITVDNSDRPNPSQGTGAVVVGMVPGPSDDLEQPGAPAWVINPDGNDTATTGQWVLGSPERSEAFDFVVQPGAPWSGKQAFVTGAAAAGGPSNNDVTGGFTTLESPPFVLTGLRTPRLSYQVYFVAADFDHEVLIPGAGDTLRVLASADGAAWVEVDRVTGMNLRWQRRLVKLADKLSSDLLASPSLRFRFVAEDIDVNNVVEAVIDDVGLVGEAATCGLPAPDAGTDHSAAAPSDGGCSCTLGRRPSERGGLAGIVHLGALAVGIGVLRRRRTRRSPS